MDISFDSAKRISNRAKHGLDLADAGEVFEGRNATRQDTRRDYGEDRFQTAGYVSGECVVLVWTPRDGGRRIISMRHVHADEEQRWFGPDDQ